MTAEVFPTIPARPRSQHTRLAMVVHIGPNPNPLAAYDGFHHFPQVSLAARDTGGAWREEEHDDLGLNAALPSGNPSNRRRRPGPAPTESFETLLHTASQMKIDVLSDPVAARLRPRPALTNGHSRSGNRYFTSVPTDMHFTRVYRKAIDDLRPIREVEHYKTNPRNPRQSRKSFPQNPPEKEDQ